jgi:hypothetical protein
MGDADIFIHVCRPRHVVGVGGQQHAIAVFAPGKREAGTHRRGGWVDPRAGLEHRNSNLELSVGLSVDSRYTDCATAAQSLHGVELN